MSNPTKRILIAEDEVHIAKLVAFKLSKEGFTVVHANNGKEAVDHLAQGHWDLLILDVMMPVMDGWEVLRQVRANPALGGLPVLMLTAKSYQQDMATASELGATQFLAKPFEPNRLTEVVRKLVASTP